MNEIDYRALLIGLGIAEHLLQSTELDFALLYQRLHFCLGTSSFRNILLVREHWQLQVLGGRTFSEDALLNTARLRDNWGATPLHYAAWSGNPKALDWINSHDPEALKRKNNHGSTPIHYAAWSGNPQALDWINNHDPEALKLKNNGGRTPVHFAARSGNPQALDWINNHDPEALKRKDNYGSTPIHFAAWSGNPQALDHALLHKINPETWTLDGNNNSKANNTLLQALKTNYTLTSLEGLDKSGMSEEEQCSVTLSLSRNRAIKEAKMQFIAFCQGINQQESPVFLLPTELHHRILKQLLPEGVDVNRVLAEVMQQADRDARMSAKITARNAKAVALIDREIRRLVPADKKHNTLLGIPLDTIYENSDAKITAFRELKKLVVQGGETLASGIRQWENTHAHTLARHRHLGSRLFSQGPTQSQCAVKMIKDGLDIKDPSPPRAIPQGPS